MALRAGIGGKGMRGRFIGGVRPGMANQTRRRGLLVIDCRQQRRPRDGSVASFAQVSGSRMSWRFIGSIGPGVTYRTSG